MVMSKATTVDQYLQELPEERRSVISRVRDTIRRNLPRGYRESLNFGMITWEIPMERYSETYNGQPLCYAGLAAQKNHNALYLIGAYADPAQREQLEEAFRKSGKKMDMGKSCLRFQRIEDLPLDTIGRLIASTSPDEHIERYEEARKSSTKKRPRAKAKSSRRR